MDQTVAHGDRSSTRFDLTPGEISTVTFEDNIGHVLVVKIGADPAYFTTDGTDPEIDGPRCYELPAGGNYQRDEPTTHRPDSTDWTKTVKIISAGSPSIRVDRFD